MPKRRSFRRWGAGDEEDTLDGVTTRGNTTSNDVSVGDLTATTAVLAGAALTDAAAGADELVIGDGSVDVGATLHVDRYGIFGATNNPGSGDAYWRFDCLGNITYLYMNGSEHYNFQTTQFVPKTTLTKDLGKSNKRWKTAYTGGLRMGVQTIGDASAAVLGTVGFVTILEGAGVNTATLPAADVGQLIMLEIQNSAAARISLATTGGDTINGAASPLAIGAGPRWLTIVAETTGDWRVAGA